MHDVFACVLKDAKGSMRQSLLVQMGPSLQPTLRDHAELVAQHGQGKTTEDQLTPLTLSGKPAFLVTLPQEPDSARQQVALVSAQGKQTFTLVVSAATGETIKPTIEAIRRGWRWLPFADPTQHLQVRAKPVPVYGGRLTLRLPEIMWQVPSADSGPMFAVYDARTGISAFTVIVNLLPETQGLTFQPLTLRQMRDNFGTLLKQRMKLSRNVLWHDVPGQPPRTISDTFAVPVTLGEPGYSAFASYGLVKLSDKEWAILTFTMTGQTAAARAAYRTAIDKIFASLRLGK